MRQPHEIGGNQSQEGVRDPFRFTQQELMAPKKPGQRKLWLDRIIAQQQEGIRNGVIPQNIRGGYLSRSDLVRWRTKVWRPYLDTLPQKDRNIALHTLSAGRQRHYGILPLSKISILVKTD